ncbi:CYTH domain-containing protein [Vreelandella subterranea]|uniref:CYTH domain-containing protein n=1 Tax=Vreelandella subterranea TaxID=416874 RepID=A0A1H9WAE2_9GAMM|nr:CYTH domain-containing protein [Halomonas subterranea]SES30926.1 CYTH domain-containing protein [Halomonas subterranea]
MSTPTEIELKLALAPGGPALLFQHPLLQSLTPKRQTLINTYFDTPKGALAEARIAVRLRQVDDQVLQTVKTAGHGGGGFSERQEWEWPVPTLELDTQRLAELPPFQGPLAESIPALVAQLNTDFVRHSWQLAGPESHIELALDQGDIHSGGYRTSICEAELELKQGEPESLWSTALALAEQVPLRPSDSSKAARGTALAAQQWPLPEATTPAQWMHRATLALDAYHDSHLADHLAIAQAALTTLASDPTLNDQARFDVETMRRALETADPPNLAYGQAALAFAHRLAYQTALR